LPKSKKVYGLTSAYIEFLHDRGIAIRFSDTEPVGPFDCLDLNLLESAAQQPFQSGFGVDFYPTVYDKAACLFFSIAGGHIFSNGNKRTAVLALDIFLMANAIYLTLSNPAVQKLAEDTAQYNERGEDHKEVIARISILISENSFEFKYARKVKPSSFYRRLHKRKSLIRSATINVAGARPKQAMMRGAGQ
jgi:death on curing protein